MWSDPVGDLRIKLSDGPTDRFRAYKRVFGVQNGANKVFKTFEYRRITDFTTAVFPMGVYKNNQIQTVASDDLSTGFFTLSSAPAQNDDISATYYIQYFTDAELTSFLRLAANFLGFGDDPTNIPGGLQNGALEFAAAEGYQKLALRFADKMSDVYRLEDVPDKQREDMVVAFREASEKARNESVRIRNDYYENRQGQALQPLFGSIRGRVFDVPPNR